MLKKSVLLLLAFVIAASCARAATLPSRDPGVVVPLLQAFHKYEGFGRIVRILGQPEEETISGFSITVFRLRDGTSVYVKATPSHNRIFGITRSAPGRLAETLYEPRDRYLRHRAPSSAPF